MSDPIDLPRVRRALARLDEATNRLDERGRSRLLRFAAGVAAADTDKIGAHMALDATLSLRTTSEVLDALDRLVEELAETPYGDVGLTRSKLADIALRRGMEALRAEAAGEVRSSPQVVERLERVTDRLEALVTRPEGPERR